MLLSLPGKGFDQCIHRGIGHRVISGRKSPYIKIARLLKSLLVYTLLIVKEVGSAGGSPELRRKIN